MAIKIDDIELKEGHVGYQVTYVPVHAEGKCDHPDCQRGEIVRWNYNYVFVLYYNVNTTQATPSHLLIWG